ncbi:MAG: hypothetical protein II604_04750 [Bacteroidales bacterium]|nr:hypothetical protein [Bacteroidales bacterium]
MAVKWAVANGNWSAGTTWNDGVVPVSGDVVYANGYTITLNVIISQWQTMLRNGYCEDTQRSGGSFVLVSSIAGINVKELRQEDGVLLKITCNSGWNYQISANLKNINNYCIDMTLASNNNIVVICADGECNGFKMINAHSNSSSVIASFTFSGNLNVNGLSLFDGTSSGGGGAITTCIINGNIYNGGIGKNVTTLTINGIYENAFNSFTCTTLNVVGKLVIKNTKIITATNIDIYGNIEYETTNNVPGIKWSGTLNIHNPDTFTWKDISEPRSNPFIILTDAEMNNRQQYPPENEVKEGTEYVWGEKVGTYQAPPESVVLKGYRYDNDEKEGTLENENIVGCVTPEDVRKDVPLVGMGEVGTLVVPSVDDVREGVIFDNSSVGTLIVEGGGDRLRIADFGYYTNAQSDTYIVDLTEQDKPKFAVAEERVLIEMFPDLDLDNIPDKYFDDLFVKFLKYRLIVEYYRTAGINSTFTPSEPTTEIVNYQNVRNEVWLNSANIYLKAWVKKYPDCITRPQRILL